jgi:hypothetical protein
VYSWGLGLSGQLGHGDKSARTHPTRINQVLGNIPVIQIAAAGNSSAAVTALGGTYMWGANNTGQLALGHSTDCSSPALVYFPQNADQISEIIPGVAHCLALTHDGQVLSWGDNQYSQLGLECSHSIVNRPVVIQALSNIHITHAAVGLSHSLVVDQQGIPYSWGVGKSGVLGHGNQDSHSLPKEIEWFRENKIRVKSVQCTNKISFCLSESSEIYAFGEIDSHSDSLKVCLLPQLVEELSGVDRMLASETQLNVLICDPEMMIIRHTIEGNVSGFMTMLEYLRGVYQQRNPYWYSRQAGVISWAETVGAIQTREANTLLHLACIYNHSEIVQLLVDEFGAYLLTRINHLSQTALHCCAENHSEDCLAILLEREDFNLNAQDHNGDTALHVAVIHGKGQRHIVERLVYRGVDKYVKNSDGMTALHLAVRVNSIHLARFLVSQGASVVERNADGAMALDYCSWLERTVLKELAESNQVFISYAHVDLDFAVSLRKLLNNFCLRCWMDDWRLKPGDDWRSAIGEGLVNADVVVFVSSSASVISDWCLKELFLAVELSKKIIVVHYQDTLIQTPMMDLLVKNVVLHSKPSDRFDCIGLTGKDFEDAGYRLARRLHNILQSMQSEQSRLPPSGSGSNLILQSLQSLGSHYVCFGFDECDSSFITYLKSQFKFYRIEYLDKMPTADDEQLVSNAWVYVLVVSEKIFKNPTILKHLHWIEKSNVHLMILYYDADSDYMDLFPQSIFSNSQISRLSKLFSFCVSDAPWMKQVIYTLNLLEKQTLLAYHIDALMEKVSEQRKQAEHLENQISSLAPSDALVDTNLSKYSPSFVC